MLPIWMRPRPRRKGLSLLLLICLGVAAQAQTPPAGPAVSFEKRCYSCHNIRPLQTPQTRDPHGTSGRDYARFQIPHDWRRHTARGARRDEPDLEKPVARRARRDCAEEQNMSWIKDLLKPETRSWKEFYRNRWQPDRIVRSTHCVSCTGGCSSRSDWEIFRSLAEQVSQLAERHLPNPIKDQITNPLARDPADDIAQPSIKDWAKGECEPLPGKTMPHLKVVERNYKNLYNQFILLGPLAHNGMGAHGVKYELADLLEYPGADWPPRLKQLSESLGDEALAEFSRQTKSLPLASLQETYTPSISIRSPRLRLVTTCLARATSAASSWRSCARPKRNVISTSRGNYRITCPRCCAC
jgi:hypothetical protein